MAKRDDYPHGERSEGTVLREHIYVDANGRNYHKKEIREGKQCPQYKWVNRRWSPGAPEKKVPYNYDRLLKHPKDQPVFFCEGEKDAESVIDIGLMGTTHPNGADKPPEYFKKLFADFQLIYIMEDNDDAGYEHAMHVAEMFFDAHQHNNGRIIKIVSFKELPRKGDVTDWLNLIPSNQEGRKKALLKHCDEAPAFRPLSIIKLQPAHGKNVDDLDRAILNAKRPVLQRGDQLVEPIWKYYPTARTARGEVIQTKITKFIRIDEASLSYICKKHVCEFHHYDRRSKKWVRCKPPFDLLHEYLSIKHWRQPIVAGITNCPTLRPDGSVLVDKGYDPVTRLWHEPPHDLILRMPDKPERKEAEEALTLFKDLLSEVAFKPSEVKPNVNLSVALAAILTAVARGGFDAAPLFFITAPNQGSGKSYLTDIITHIVTGRGCPAMSLVGPRDEKDKRIAALMLEGTPIISLDNLTNNLDDVLLCQMIERPFVKVRVLGKSEAPECEWRGTLFATGNNEARLAGDMLRRGLTCHIDREEERPEKHQYKKDPLQIVLANRGKYIAAALTIVRAFLLSKEEIDCEPMGSFKGFTEFVRKPLIWLGEADPLLSQDDMVREDPTKTLSKNFLRLWADANYKNGKTTLGLNHPIRAHEIIAIANKGNPNYLDHFGREEEEGAMLGELWEILIGKCSNDRGNAIDAKRLGFWLRDLRGQIHDGLIVDVYCVDKKNSNQWRLIRAKG